MPAVDLRLELPLELGERHAAAPRLLVLLEPAEHLPAARLRVKLHRPGPLAHPEGLRAGLRGRKLDPAPRDLEGVVVADERLEALGQHAEHRVARTCLRQLNLDEPDLLLGQTVDVPAERVGERLGAETDREERELGVDEVAHHRVLVLEPRVVRLLAHVHVPAEHDHRVEVAVRRGVEADVPLDQLVPGLHGHVAEELRPDLGAVNHRQNTHGGTLVDATGGAGNESGQPLGCPLTYRLSFRSSR